LRACIIAYCERDGQQADVSAFEPTHLAREALVHRAGSVLSQARRIAVARTQRLLELQTTQARPVNLRNGIGGAHLGHERRQHVGRALHGRDAVRHDHARLDLCGKDEWAGLQGKHTIHTFSRCGVSSTIELSGTSRRS